MDRGPIPKRYIFTHTTRGGSTCGISRGFPLLCRTSGQVTHVLLTRSPLSHQLRHPEGISKRCFVRLACLRHTASVHPEPGSNSPRQCQIEVLTDRNFTGSHRQVNSATRFSRISAP